MNNVRYMAEGKGKCAKCAREVDVVVPCTDRPGQAVVSRHLLRIEEYGPKGVRPEGFCQGSLSVPELPPERPRHNHPTRDIKKPGQCPACDARRKPAK
jgi:hypothetical protein